MALYKPVAASGSGFRDIEPTDQIAVDASVMTIVPTGAPNGSGGLLADALRVLPRHFGVVADATLNANGTLASGTDQTSKLNAYLAYCLNNKIAPEIPASPTGTYYLCDKTLVLYSDGIYRGDFLFPNNGSQDPAITIDYDPADLITGSVSDVLEWGRLKRGSSRIPGLTITTAGVKTSLKGYFVTVSTGDECTFGRDPTASGGRMTDGGHGFYVNDDNINPTEAAKAGSKFASSVNDPRYTAIITHPLYVDFRPLGATSTNKSGTFTSNTNNPRMMVWRRQHGMVNNATFTVAPNVAGTTLPAGLSEGPTYYVVNATINAFQIATSAGGTPLTFTGAGDGVPKITPTSGTPAAFTATINGATPITATGHGMTEGCPVRVAATHNIPDGTAVTVSSTGTLPGGVAAGTTYYVVNGTAPAFQISASSNGTLIAYTSPGTGTITVSVVSPARTVWVTAGGMAGGPLAFTTTAVLPGGLASTSTYFAVQVFQNSFYLANAPFAAGITFTSTGAFNGGAHSYVGSPEYAWPWTDRLTEVRAQRVRHPIRISGLRLTFYKPSSGAADRNKTILVKRANTVVDLPYLRNVSGIAIAQGLLVEKTFKITISEAHAESLLDVATNYSIHVGMSNDVVINASSGVDCRRSFDTHRGYGITLNGGTWSNGIGGHWGVNVRVNNAIIANSVNCVHLAGRDFFATNCHFVITPDVFTKPTDVRASFFQVRDDEFNFSGALVFKGCLFEVDATDVTSGVTLVNLEGPATGYDAWRTHEMPSNVSLDSSNTVRIWGGTLTNSTTSTYVTYCQYLRDFDTTFKQSIQNARNIEISPVVVFDNEDLATGTVPRCRFNWRNAPNLIGGDCFIKVSNARDMWFTAINGSGGNAKATGRCVIDLQANGLARANLYGGAFRRARIDAPSYSEENRRGTWGVGDERIWWTDAELGDSVKRTIWIRNPASGATLQATAKNPQIYVTGTATIASLTLNLPAGAIEDQRCTFIFGVAVTAASFGGNGLTISGSPPATIGAGQQVKFQVLQTGVGLVWQYLI